MSTASYNAANHQTAFGSQALTYDLNGNLTSDGTNTYSWNARDQLVSMSGPGLSASFQYDASGRRVSKTINGTTTSFLYDGDNVVQEKQGASVTANILSGGIDEIFSRAETSATHSPVADGLGSTVALTDSAGAIQTQYTYEPFGKTSQSGPTSNNPSQFTGRENDGTGLYYYRARYYSPTLERFINEDPVEFDGGDVNLYSYVANDPINFIDPSGLERKPSFFEWIWGQYSRANEIIDGPKGPSWTEEARGPGLGRAIRKALKLFGGNGIPTRHHFRRRLATRQARGITEHAAFRAYCRGTLYYNRETGNYIRHDNISRVSVVVDRPCNGTAISVFEGNPSPTWERVKWRPGLE